MADTTNVLFGAAEAAMLLAYVTLGNPILLPALLAAAITHLAYSASRKAPGNEWLVTYASVLSDRYSTTGAIVHSIGTANSQAGLKTFGHVTRRYLLGDPDPLSRGTGHGGADGMSDMLSFAMRSGRSIAGSISEFRKRASRELELTNAIRAKSGAMKSVTYLGLIFFLPLFGGVSSNVMASLSSAASQLSLHMFLYAVLAYVALALFITSYAYEDGGSPARRSLGVLPLFSISAFVLFFTSSYISGIL